MKFQTSSIGWAGSCGDSRNSDELAAVRFTGLLRESPQEPAQPIDEVWNFTRPVDRSSGWVLAGIEQRGAT